MNMFRTLRLLFACVLPTAADRADCAIIRAANTMAEAERERIKANFYTCMLLDIDPNTDWHLFAQIKQKEHDAQYSHVRLLERATAANVRAEARIEEMKEKAHENVVSDTVDAGPAVGVIPGSVRLN